MEKQSLRLEIKNKLSVLDDSDLNTKSHSIGENLSSLLPKLSSKENEFRLGVFAPIQKEPKWFKGFRLQDHLSFLMVHMHEDIKLSFHQMSWEKIISEKIPLRLEDKFTKDEHIPHGILIPGLAFTKSMNRLGRGKAYYDSYLKNYSGIKIGLCFEMQMVEDVFAQDHDQSMDYIVTEKNIYTRG